MAHTTAEHQHASHADHAAQALETAATTPADNAHAATAQASTAPVAPAAEHAARPPVSTEPHAATAPAEPGSMHVPTAGHEHPPVTHHATAAEHDHPAKREHLAPAEAATPATQPHHPPQPHLPDAQLVILPGVMKAAEEYLAKAVASHITPTLREGLMLTLQSDLGKEAGTTEVRLTLHGPLVAGNAALMGKEIIAALEKDPLLADLFKGEHKPHVQKVDGQPEMLQVHITHLSTAQYAQLIQKLAAARNAPAQPHAQEAMAAAPAAQGDAIPSAMQQLQALQQPQTQITTPAMAQGLVAANSNIALGAAG